MSKCEKCGLEGDSTQIKPCPDQIKEWANKLICKNCYQELKKIEENKLIKDKSTDQNSSKINLNNSLKNKKFTPGQGTDWKILVIQFIGFLALPPAVFYFGETIFNLSYELKNLLIRIAVIPIILIITYIYYREAKKWTDQYIVQSIIFGVTFIPFIISINWIEGLVYPQIVYWLIQKLSWKESNR